MTDMHHRNYIINNLILDVDGVLWIAGAPGEGACLFLKDLIQEKIPFCLLTNDCSVSKEERYEELTQAGLVLRADQLVTAVDITIAWLQKAAADSLMYLGAPSILPDLERAFCIRKCGPVDAVVIGDFFAHYDRYTLDKAAKAVCEGAILIAMQRNARWSDGKDWYIDNGFWVAGLEYVTGRQAIVTGKPNQDAYMTALSQFRQRAHNNSLTAFVSDDIMSDLKGAKDVGLTTIYFGSTQILPSWIDLTAPNFDTLISILVGHGHD